MAGLLTGMRVLVTRNKEQAGPFTEQLKKEGAEPVMLPLLAFSKNDHPENYDILARLHEYDWLFFTSANGVKFFFCLLNQWNLALKENTAIKIAAVGKKTAMTLEEHRIAVDFQPSEFNGRSMVKEFLSSNVHPGKVLLVAGNLSRGDIGRELEKQQVFFQSIVVYDTIMDENGEKELRSLLKKDNIDVYTFTSPSSVQAFDRLSRDMNQEKHAIKRKKFCVCIGETTKKAAEQAGFLQTVVPAESTIEGMVEVIKKYASRKG